jgi:hypothetical protein
VIYTQHLEEIKKAAEKTILANGQHAPMLIGFSGGNMLPVVVEDFPETSTGRQRLFLRIGGEVGSKFEVEEFYFISEAWMSHAKKDGSYIQPSKDPKRKEALIINCCDPSTSKDYMVIYEMIRDKSGNLIELKNFDQKGLSEVESHLLQAFRDGYSIGRAGKIDELKELMGDF